MTPPNRESKLTLISNREHSPSLLMGMMRKNDFFSSMDQDELGMLSYWFNAYSAPSGTVLLREGEGKAFLLIVSEGKINIFKSVEGEEEHIKIADVLPGGSLGEMSVVDGKPISATAISAQDTKILIITPEDFNQVINKNCNLGNRLMMTLLKIISQRLRNASSLLADSLSDQRARQRALEDSL